MVGTCVRFFCNILSEHTFIIMKIKITFLLNIIFFNVFFTYQQNFNSGVPNIYQEHHKPLIWCNMEILKVVNTQESRKLVYLL